MQLLSTLLAATHLSTFLFYAALLLLTLLLLLPLFLRLSVLPRGLSIGHFTLTAIHNFRWVSAAPDGTGYCQGRKSEQDRLSVEVKKIRLAWWAGRGRADEAPRKDGRGAWIVLRVEGVRVKIPKAFSLSPPRQAKQKPMSTPQRKPSTSPPSSTPSSRRSSVAADAPTRPTRTSTPSSSSQLTSLLSRFAFLLRIFAVQIDFQVDVEDVAFVEGVLSAGGEVQKIYPSRGSSGGDAADERDAAMAKAWVRLERLKVTENLRGLDKNEAKGGKQSGDAAQKKPLPALELPRGVVLNVRAPLVAPSASRGWSLRPGSVKLAIEFGGEEPKDVAASARKAAKGVKTAVKERLHREAQRRSSSRRAEGEKSGRREQEQQACEEIAAGALHVRVHELKRVIRNVEELAHQRERQRPPPSSPASDTSFSTTSSPPKPSPLIYLRSVSLSLPAFILSAHYTTPLHVIAASSSSPNHQLPESMAFALTITGAKVDVQLGGTSEDKGVRGEHREWVGKEREIGCAASLEWRELEGRVKVNGSEDEILHDAAKTLSIGASRLDLSSTWLPSKLAALLSSPGALPPANPPPVNHNDSTVIVEGFLGEVRGHAPYETLDSGLRIFKARPRTSRTRRSGSASSNAPSFSPTTPISPIRPAPPRHPSLPAADSPPPFFSRTLHSLPRIVGSLASAGIELRVQAPQPASSATDDPTDSSTQTAMEGDPTDPFFRSWESPELLCVSLPRGQLSFGGEYLERSVRRTEAERRLAKRNARHRRGESKTSQRSFGRGGGAEEEEEEDEREREFYRSEGLRASTRERERDRGRSYSARRGREEEQEAGYQGTRAFEEEFGVPPPPPLTKDYVKRRLNAHEVPANSTKDLAPYGLEYTTRFLLVAESLNVYVLANNHGGNDDADFTDSEDGWDQDRYSMPALPSDPIRLDIFAVGPLELSSTFTLLGDERVDSVKGSVPFLDISTCIGEHNILLDTIGIDLWRPIVRGCIRDFLSSFASASETATARSRAASEATSPLPPSSASTLPPQPQPLVDLLPPRQSIYFSLASSDLRIAGTDPKADAHACRGVAAHTGPLVLEYLLQDSHVPVQAGNFAERSALELREDIRVEAMASINPHATHGAAALASPAKTALLKLSLVEFSVDPVVDARASRGQRRYMRRGDGEGEEEGDDWELRGRAEMADGVKRRKSIIPPRYEAKTAGRGKEKVAASSLVVVPHLALRLKIQKAPPLLPRHGDHAEDDEGGSPRPLDEIIVNLEMESITLRLELFSIYLCLVAISSLRTLRPDVRLSSAAKDRSSSSLPRRPPPLVQIRADIADFHVFPTLPHDTHLFINFRRVRFSQSKELGVEVDFDSALLAGGSPTIPEKWEDIIRLQAGALRIRPQADNDGQHPFVISLSTETARLRIPFRYIFSRIIDNAANLVKATKQLVFEHIKGGKTFILEPGPEDAKQLPQIDLNVGLLAVSMQDDPFETKLNIIWRAGYEEQSARIDREAAFDAKVEAIRRREANGGEDGDEEGGEEESRAFSNHPKVDGKHSIGVEEARRDLLAYNSSHWIKRMRNAAAEQARREETLLRQLYGTKHQSLRPDARLPIDLCPVNKSVPLARATFHNFRFSLSKPSFGDDGLSDFLNDVGKGLPRDTQFSLLVPLHISWKMDEARFRLRDYPLPLLHVPPNGDPEHASWEFEADLVIAEEVGGPESVRRIPCAIIPQHVFHGQGAPYSIVVPRSAMTVKTYMTPTIKIRTDEPTRIGWGNSVQPAVQDLARVIDTLSKPSPDPSDRIGFWDKIRLQLHWRVLIQFEGPRASVIFHLKGSRDPYALTGFGAGFAKAWKGNVQFRIGFDNPDREFFQVLSEEYILGIPNLRNYVDAAATGATAQELDGDRGRDDRSVYNESVDGTYDETQGSVNESQADDEESNYWIKICAKCINGVRWGLGLVCEQTCRENCVQPGCKEQSTFHRKCRFFDFIPHWEVHTKTSASIGPNGEVDDSFAGFRSDFVHFSLSLTSPATLDLPGREQSSTDPSEDYAGERGYNSLHFTPHANTHFARWWKLFDGTLSLPIRQGKLFPSAQAPSKKFGKHCATIKYRFSLAPLFISHTYRQESWAEWARGETTVLGLKGKIGRFNVDLHQREQEMSIRRPEMSESKLVKHKAFYLAEIDLDGVDLRTITACFKEPEKAYVAPIDNDADQESEAPAPTFDDFQVADEDVDWINLNDFNDAAYTMPDRRPHLRLLPLMTCPRFTYYRSTDAAPVRETDTGSESDLDELLPHQNGKTKFGKEPTHTCLAGCASDTIAIQIKEAQIRLLDLEAQVGTSRDAVREQEIKLRIKAVHGIIEQLERARARDAQAAHDVDGDPDETSGQPPREPSTPSSRHEEAEDNGDPSHLPHFSNALGESWDEWENRYMIHNPTISISNVTREVLLKYYYSSQDRKGHVYHVSASVIRFIRDLAKEHDRKNRKNWSRRKSTRTGGSTSLKKNSGFEDSQEANRLLDQFVNREGSFWATNEAQEGGERHQFGSHLNLDPEAAAQALPEAFEGNTGHLCMFFSPQISLQSDIDEKSTLIITALRAQLKVFSIIDTRIPDDPVNAEVLHQTFARLDGLQVFYPREQGLSDGSRRHAFVPLETLIDLRVEPWGFDRVVPRTMAAFRYDKFNQLRLSSKRATDDGGIGTSSGLESHFHTSTDRMAIECEKFSMSADPAHFAAIYNVVTDLLLYSDPTRKSRSTKLEALVFTRDFSNLRSVVESVQSLQERIRGLTALMHEYHVHLDELDDDGRVELALARAEHLRLASELGFIIEALTRAQDSNGPKTTSKRPGVQLEAKAGEITWHMLDKGGVPFAKFSVLGTEFSWVSKQDGSASNRLAVQDLRALNSSPEQIFAEIIAKHETSKEDNIVANIDLFAAALWTSLAPVGGISIIERFELHLHPVRLQLEHRVGRKILDYLFSETSQKHGDEREEDPASPKHHKPTSPLVSSNSNGSRSVDSLALTRGSQASSSSLNMNRSSTALNSSNASIRSAEHRLRKTVSAEVLAPESKEEGLDADEMRRRAASNRTFIFVEISSTVLCLTYRSEKEDKSSLPNIYNITYKTPQIQYRAKTWSFYELLDEIKRDTIKSVWQQKGQLIGQLLSTAHRKMPLQQARSAAKQRAVSVVRNRFSKSKRHEEPLVGRGPPSLRPSPAPLSNDFDSSSSDDDEPPVASDELPFDVGAAQLINPGVGYEDRPQAVRVMSARARGEYTEEPGQYGSNDGARPGLQATQSSYRSGSSGRSNGSADSYRQPPPTLPQQGYPHHEPLRRGTEEIDDEEKRRLLLGRSAD